MKASLDRRLDAARLVMGQAVTQPKPRRTLGRTMRNWSLCALVVFAIIVVFFAVGVATGSWV